AIHTYMGSGPEAAALVRTQLTEEFGEGLAAIVEKMLIGFPRDEASNPETIPRLVGLLAPEQQSIGVREIALATLKRLTGRDDLGYNPDRPEGKGLAAWKELAARRSEQRTPQRAAKGTKQ